MKPKARMTNKPDTWEAQVDKLFDEVYLYSEAGAVETAHVEIKKLIRSLLSKDRATLKKRVEKSREKLAELEHDQWMKWAKTLMEKEPISEERRKRWEALMVPYSELSEKMKDHDRKWADKVLALLGDEE